MTYSQRRTNFFWRIWREVSRSVVKAFAGSQRPLATQTPATVATKIGRNYDLEISEWPIRDRDRARLLIEMREHCPEIGTAIAYIKDDVVSSEDGDDQGVVIAGLNDEDDNELPIDPEVKQVAEACLERCIGTDEIELVTDRILSYGDCFANLDIDVTAAQVNGLLFLPTWELFRVEQNGKLTQFEQRRWLGQEPAEVTFHPITIVHWRYNRQNLYGRPLHGENLEDWGRLKEATMDLSMASRDVGVNPIIHLMPEGTSKDTRDAYIRDHEQKLASGLITHYYPWGGIDIKRMADNDPDLTSLLNNFKEWRMRIAMRSRLPLYLYGLHNTGAKDIAGQPALAYSRFINSVRRCLGMGIRQVIDTELALKGIPKERWQYRLAWPRFITTISQANDEGPQSDTEPGSSGDKSDGSGEEKQQSRRLKAV